MSLTRKEIKALEERRRALVKLQAAGKGGPAVAMETELYDIDVKIAAAMGVSVQALAGMRPK